MELVDQQTQQQISDLVNACRGYWELRGIPQDRRNEMRLELEQHLEQAVRDGKSLEAVVGPNALAFAESWARETPHQSSRGFSHHPSLVGLRLADLCSALLEFDCTL